MWRDETEVLVTVNLGKQPSLDELAAIENDDASVFLKELGIKIRSLNDDDKQRLGIEKSIDGVLITELEPDSFLMRQNIFPEDIIIEIQNRSIKSAADAISAIEEVISQGKENILMVFYAGPNSRKYIGARLSLD